MLTSFSSSSHTNGIDSSVRRSNLVVKGVVTSVRRELKDSTTNKTNVFEDKNKIIGGGIEGSRGGDAIGATETAFEAFSTTVPHYGEPSNNVSMAANGEANEGKLEHVVTFVLDASTDAYIATQRTPIPSGSPTATPTRNKAFPTHPSSTQKTAKVPANTITLRLCDDWALSTSFVAVGDIIEASKFDVEYLATGALMLVANSSTELHVTRMKHIAINAANVGQLEVLELTEREQAEARHAFTNIPPQRFGDKNVFAHVDLYYDIIKGQSATINPQMSFLQSLFGFRTSVLDAGCGSGLYSFAFRGYGVYPVCVDASHAMQRRFEEKNHFFQQAEAHQKKVGNGAVAIAEGSTEGEYGGASPTFMGANTDPNTTRSTFMARKAQKALALRGTSELEFHLADLASFSLAKRDADGNVRYTEFEGVLCLDVLALLPDVAAIRAALHNLSLHTGRGGVVVLSVPNTTVALERGCHMSTSAFPIDRFKLSVGAASVPHRDGTLHLTETVLIDNLEATSSDIYKSGAAVTNQPTDALRRPNASTISTPQSAHFRALPSLSSAPYNGSSIRPPASTSSGAQNQYQHVPSEALARRVTTWRGTAFHPSAPGNANKFVSFVETFTELLLPAGLIEQLFTECGLAVKALYGSLTGEAFLETSSDNRYYVLQRA